MKQWMMFVMVLVLSACSSTTTTKLYQLPVDHNAVSSVSGKTGGAQKLLWVSQISVPDFLAGSGVVYQTSDVNYVVAKQNLWASPLDQQLRDTLVANLSTALPGWVVSSQPLGNDQDSLSVVISGFQGRYDGQVVVSGEWLLNQKGEYTRRPFSVTLPQQGDGYDAMVKGLATAWQQEARSIAAQLQAQH
ncbi:membrane integrity-associated transporter subunit PqiC [Mangrovibacter phragmitis]|uniref:membrane integrity-associated transporter subunit PqiC n=1 Tax=Mangrovibacter phragmitis TaxID=1691903 RepID=UPI00336AB727